ncbi:MAG: hypothetical protein HY717_13860 [Planctomycetes bacterium]|nr:hypothetical protein [Planctomycetota bacterium]
MNSAFKILIVVFLGTISTLASAQGNFSPQGIESAGLRRLAPDALIHPEELRPRRKNWEPYTSVLGEDIFLIQSNIFAEDPNTPPDPSFQMIRYGLVFQKAGGGSPVYGEVFFADGGSPYKGPINNYRQDGNPGRVAGDQRPGAANFIAGGEASPDEYPEFRSDGRWDTGVARGGRYAAVQSYALNPGTLEQKPLYKAFDSLNGRLTSGNPGTDQISRFGGDLAALDNGNFVALVEDRSGLQNQQLGGGIATSAVLVAPDGSIVKETFVINQGEIWSNLAAFQGGFCVRQQGTFWFFDNAGKLQGSADQAPPELVDPLGNPIAFDRGRGDGTRIAGHINTPFVFLAGAYTDPLGRAVCRLAAWDSRDRGYVAQVNVNELTPANGGIDAVDFLPALGRVNLAVDALNRAVVAYEVQPAEFLAQQVAARVFAFDPEKKEFRALTPTFFPFVNSNPACFIGGGARHHSFRPSPAMTTRAICIAAKGEINPRNIDGDNDFCADSPALANFYTVFTHPDPQDDPTPPAPAAGGSQLPGDCNQDGAADLSDAICLLSHLFLGNPERLPCEGGKNTDPGNRRLLDFNGDGPADLSDAVALLQWKFLGGAAHPLGEACIPISGCPSLCQY